MADQQTLRRINALRKVFKGLLLMGNGMNKVLPGLYLGNLRDAKDKEQLNKYSITHVLSIHDTAAPIYPDEQKYLCIKAGDVPQQNIRQHFSEAIDFIHKARCNGHNVLIHCLCGVSRSTTLVVAYVITVTEYSWKDALRCVKHARPVANPNFGFQTQLEQYQTTDLPKERERVKKQFPSYRRDRDEKALQYHLEEYNKFCRSKMDDDIFPVPSVRKRYSWRPKAKTPPHSDEDGEQPKDLSVSKPQSISSEVVATAAAATAVSDLASGLQSEKGSDALSRSTTTDGASTKRKSFKNHKQLSYQEQSLRRAYDVFEDRGVASEHDCYKSNRSPRTPRDSSGERIRPHSDTLPRAHHDSLSRDQARKSFNDRHDYENIYIPRKPQSSKTSDRYLTISDSGIRNRGSPNRLTSRRGSNSTPASPEVRSKNRHEGSRRDSHVKESSGRSGNSRYDDDHDLFHKSHSSSSLPRSSQRTTQYRKISYH